MGGREIRNYAGSRSFFLRSRTRRQASQRFHAGMEIVDVTPSSRASAAATTPLWQREFFDHILRSDESYAQKWEYVRENPMRVGLVSDPDDWPFAGTIELLQK
jgi:hypothetical protein